MNPLAFTIPIAPGTIAPLDVISRFGAHDYTLMSLLESRVRLIPDKEFIVFEGRSLSYAEVWREVLATAQALAARGVKKGDRIGVISPNHPMTVFTFFALAHLGAIMVSVNADYGVEEVRYVFNHAGVSGVFAAPEALERAQAACAAMSPLPWFTLNQPGAGDVPQLRPEPAPADIAAPAGAAAPDATVILVYTSGTTGFPKGVMHSQKNHGGGRRRLRRSACTCSPTSACNVRAADVPHQRDLLFPGRLDRRRRHT